MYHSNLSLVWLYSAVEKRRPLVPTVPGSNPVMNGFCLWAFSNATTRVLVMSPGSRQRAWLIWAQSLLCNRCKINKFKLHSLSYGLLLVYQKKPYVTKCRAVFTINNCTVLQCYIFKNNFRQQSTQDEICIRLPRPLTVGLQRQYWWKEIQRIAPRRIWQ